jgi:oxygen-independent coproporphyrinogen-3 oxidase
MAKYQNDKYVFDPKYLEKYTCALCNDIENTHFPVGDITSVVFGGGTPSLLSKKQFVEIMNTLRKKAGTQLRACESYAYEMSPSTMNKSMLNCLNEHGFNRISIGIQSFIDDELKLLGRQYAGDCAIDACRRILALDYDCVNIDLLIGFPGQSTSSLLSSLRTAIDLKPQHISINLFYKSYPGGDGYIESCAAKGKILPSLSKKILLYKKANDELASSGYEQLDNTVYTQKGYKFDYEKEAVGEAVPVLSFGPGSAGYWNNAMRYTPPEIESYLDVPKARTEELSIDKHAFATVWGQLNVYHVIKDDLTLKMFGMTLSDMRMLNADIDTLLGRLVDADMAVDDGSSVGLKNDKVVDAIVLMHHIRDNWGYRLVTAPRNIEEEERGSIQ